MCEAVGPGLFLYIYIYIFERIDLNVKKLNHRFNWNGQFLAIASNVLNGMANLMQWCNNIELLICMYTGRKFQK
jgi:hypothetical protein